MTITVLTPTSSTMLVLESAHGVSPFHRAETPCGVERDKVRVAADEEIQGLPFSGPDLTRTHGCKVY